MLKLGLTGSMAAGKSRTLENFARLGAPVFDADAAVHDLYVPGGAAVGPVLAAFPRASTAGGGVDRKALSELLRARPEDFARLERIVHPLVARVRADFLARARRSGAPYAVLDIPLLFETGLDAEMDKIVVVVAPASLRRARALARPGVTEEKWRLMEARQIPQAEKRARADFLIDASGALEDNLRQTRNVHEKMLAAARRREDRT